jgi:hypothetical protein
MLSMTNWKMCLFFSCYFDPSSSVKHFERSFFTFWRSFWRTIRLTMQLSTMDSVIPEVMMVPACCRQSPILLVAVLSPSAYFFPQQRWDKSPESYWLLFLVTHGLLGLEFLTELHIRRDALLAKVATYSPFPLMQLFQHRMISFPGACFWFALACKRAFRSL